MRKSSECKNQHYVPQFLLRNFATGKKTHIYVFDTLSEKVFKTTVRNIGTENAFYDYDNGDSIDPKLGALETLTSPIIKRIVDNESLGSLNAKDKSIISFFCAVQMLRVKFPRESLKELNNGGVRLGNMVFDR